VEDPQAPRESTEELTERGQEMLDALRSWHVSGTSLRAYAKEHGLNHSTLSRWRRRLIDSGLSLEVASVEAPVEAPAGSGEPPVLLGPGEQLPSEMTLSSPWFYLNRELTWLEFNSRVLHEAEDERTLLLERLKFLAIVSSNLDEFFMKRIGGLMQQVGAEIHTLSVDGRRPKQQISECYQKVRALEARKDTLMKTLVQLLSDNAIELRHYNELSADEQATLREHYLHNIFPLITPQAVDPAHPFPFVSNLSLNLLITLHYPGDQKMLLARVKAPVGAGTSRFLKVGEGHRYVLLEEVMANNLDLLFPGMVIEGCELFRVTRNANTERDEEQADDLLVMIKSELRERKFAPIVRLEVAEGMVPLHRGWLAAELGLDEDEDVFEVTGMVGRRDLMEIACLDIPELCDPPHAPYEHPELTGDRSIFHVIRDAGSILLFHPYESFSSSVERFLREASEDPKVRAIKMTLYRTSAKTQVIQHLLAAARNGKQVAVVVELKARFDEAANIRWASRLEEAGIHVTYGVVGLKTHCKAILVVRQDYNGLTRYAHIGTGNYHAGTARMYTDLGLFTSDDKVGHDLTELFNYLTTGYSPTRDYQKLLVAPKLMKSGLIARIQREIRHQQQGGSGLIQIKTNALEDVDITRALYRAARAGVHINLIVRDTCRLRPQLPGLTETVHVISIVGRFLEHARVVYFQNGGDEEYFIGSADCMTRNLNSRVEVMVPVENPELQANIRHMLDTQLADRRGAWDMQPDGTYIQRTPSQPSEEVSAQTRLVNWARRRHKEATRLRRRKPKGPRRNSNSETSGI